jgi:hypothetical protein
MKQLQNLKRVRSRKSAFRPRTSKTRSKISKSNDHWLKGREISLEKYEKEYKAEPLIMSETTIGSEIKSPTNDLFINTILINIGAFFWSLSMYRKKKILKQFIHQW